MPPTMLMNKARGLLPLRASGAGVWQWLCPQGLLRVGVWLSPASGLQGTQGSSMTHSDQGPVSTLAREVEN